MNADRLSAQFAALCLCFVAGAAGCQSAPAETRPSPSPSPAADAAQSWPAGGPVELKTAAPGPLRQLIVAELELAERDQKRLLVYVGADWCEPCERFRKAALAGELNESLAGLRLLTFDAERDGERLLGAGYGGQMLPRLVLPRADGRASAQRMEGSIKGPGAVAQMTPRVLSLMHATP